MSSVLSNQSHQLTSDVIVATAVTVNLDIEVSIAKESLAFLSLYVTVGVRYHTSGLKTLLLYDL